ncbi:hypothetical protein DFH11DRAFT_589956 [Phellopilus nigrolimitatus]|nr:hypothetical protein DFH11DRAFT_589956 [Phellopilus nigrolimitatus]
MPCTMPTRPSIFGSILGMLASMMPTALRNCTTPQPDIESHGTSDGVRADEFASTRQGRLNMKQKAHALKHWRRKAPKIKGQTLENKKQARADGKRLKKMILGRRGGWRATRSTSTRQCKPAESRRSSLAPSPPRRRRSRPAHTFSPGPSGAPAASNADSPELRQPQPQKPKSSRRSFNLTRAYSWFHTARSAVLHHGRADYELAAACLPHELIIMLANGWVALEECLVWQDGRTTLGEGLVYLATTGIVSQWGEMKRPSAQTVKKEGEGFMEILRISSTYAYNWDSDAEDRKQYGPFGSALASYADATTLEQILAQLANPGICNESIVMPDGLKAVLAPLFVCSLYPLSEENEEDASSSTQSKQNEGDTDPIVSSSEPAGVKEDNGDEDHILPAKTATENMCFNPPETLAHSNASPRVSASSTLFNGDSPLPSVSSTVGPSPWIIGRSQLSTPPIKDDLHPSPAQEKDHDYQASLQDSEMDLDEVDQFVSTCMVPEDVKLDVSAIPFVYCVDQEVEMLPAEAEREPDATSMMIDALSPPLPQYPSSFFVGANRNEVMSNMDTSAYSVDEEMQMLPTPLPLFNSGHRALQRTESVVMDVEPAFPQLLRFNVRSLKRWTWSLCQPQRRTHLRSKSVLTS